MYSDEDLDVEFYGITWVISYVDNPKSFIISADNFFFNCDEGLNPTCGVSILTEDVTETYREKVIDAAYQQYQNILYKKYKD